MSSNANDFCTKQIGSPSWCKLWQSPSTCHGVDPNGKTVYCCAEDTNCPEGSQCTNFQCSGGPSPPGPPGPPGPPKPPGPPVGPPIPEPTPPAATVEQLAKMNRYNPNPNKKPPKKKGRNFRLTLWHEGVVDVAEKDLPSYFNELTQFVWDKEVDRCFFNLMDAGASKYNKPLFPYSQPEFVVKNYLAKLPDWCTAGVLLYVNPLYNWGYVKKNVVGGIQYNNPGYKDGTGDCSTVYHSCSGINDNKCFADSTPKLPPCGHVPPPPPSGCKSDSECPGVKKCVNGKCVNPSDPCSQFPGSYCQNGICHGHPEVHCGMCSGDSDCPDHKKCVNGKCVSPSDPCAQFPGSYCQNGVCHGHPDVKCGNKPSSPCAQFPGSYCQNGVCHGHPGVTCESFQFATPNLGGSGDKVCKTDADCSGGRSCIDSACVWPKCATIKDFCPTDPCCVQYPAGCPNNLEQGMILINDINTLARKMGVKKLITSVAFDGEDMGHYGADAWGMAQAWQAAEKYAPDVNDIGLAKGPGTNTCDTRTTSAYPEMYWIGELKPPPRQYRAGVVCAPGTVVSDDPTDDGVCCSMCKAPVDMDFSLCNDPQRIQNACQNKAIDHRADCIQNTQMNCRLCENCKQSIYIRYRNDPQGMLQAFSKYLDPYKDLVQHPGTCPLFSIENAHNMHNKTCMQKEYSQKGGICGTFDGWGDWDWSPFEEFLNLYAAKYNVHDCGIYEAQFLPPSWRSTQSPNILGGGSNGSSRVCFWILVALVLVLVLIILGFAFFAKPVGKKN